MFFLQYDENLPKYYNQNHAFLWKRMDNKLLSKTRLFEKIEINWFSVSEIKSRREEFRSFYREIVDKILDDKEAIIRFVEENKQKKNSRNSRTRKNIK